MAKTRDDFLDDLRSQLRFLRSSSVAYDAGSRDEAQRLSNAVSIMLDTRGKNNKSILDHLDISSCVPMLSTSQPLFKGNLAGASGLTHFVMADGINAYHAPNLYGLKNSINGLETVDQWLDGYVVALGDDALTRRDLIRSLRDNDGGAHVDVNRRNKLYKAIAEDHFITFFIQGKPVKGLAYA